MKKKVLMLLVMVLLGIAVVGCGNFTPTIEATAEAATGYEIFELVADCGDNVKEYRDSVTGVHYFVFDKYTYNSEAGGICPRYNSDGSLYVK